MIEVAPCLELHASPLRNPALIIPHAIAWQAEESASSPLIGVHSRSATSANRLRVLDLFSGIGGFSRGLEETGGFETVAFCETNPFARLILRNHWPNTKIYGDVRELTSRHLAANGISRVDLICGGFPCQDISSTGKRAGIGGSRSGLWSEFVRLVREIRPSYVLVENVIRLLSGSRGSWFGRVLGDLAALGYDAEWHGISAANVGAPHFRERVWIVAYPNGWGLQGGIVQRTWPSPDQLVANGRGRFGYPIGAAWSGEPDVDLLVHGFPHHVDHVRVLGNAVVPLIPRLLGEAILRVEQDRSGLVLVPNRTDLLCFTSGDSSPTAYQPW